MDITAKCSLVNKTIGAYVTTRGRTDTTLALSVMSVLQQSRKIDSLTIYDDNPAGSDSLLDHPVFGYVLKYADDNSIPWIVYPVGGMGLIHNHNHALHNLKEDYIFRFDDDVYYDFDVLEKLEGAMSEAVATAPLVYFNTPYKRKCPKLTTGALLGIHSGCVQWFEPVDDELIFPEFLYSTFLYDREVALRSAGYPTNLSSLGYCDDGIFSHNLKREGGKIAVVPTAVAHHFMQSTGGIRSSYATNEMYYHDIGILHQSVREWGYYPHIYSSEAYILLPGIDLDIFSQIYKDIISVWKEVRCVFFVDDAESLSQAIPDITIYDIRDYIEMYELKPEDEPLHGISTNQNIIENLRSKYVAGRYCSQMFTCR